MPRALWKGAISFGLVHVPVALYPASDEGGIDFDWLDQRTMDPVGYKRINKRTGREIASEHIVRGVKVGDDRYVVLGEDEIKSAFPKTTQTIEIDSFVAPAEVPFTLLERPYYLEPLPRSEKVYALLRDAMQEAGVVGVARVVLHTKEHLAVLAPAGQALLLDTLRWASEIRPLDGLKLPAEGAAKPTAAELKMASRLIADMTEPWRPERFRDRFTEAVQALVEQRATAGASEPVKPLEPEPAPHGANIVDLTRLLERSLRAGIAAPDGAKAQRAAAAKAPAKKRSRTDAKATARKRA